jgi:hypothetical protein
LRKQIEIASAEALRVVRQREAVVDISGVLSIETFNYPTPEGIYLDTEIILILAGSGIILFCCGLSVSLCIVRKYRQQKIDIIRTLRQNRELLDLSDLDEEGIFGNTRV